jgi:hypothetical protein
MKGAFAPERKLSLSSCTAISTALSRALIETRCYVRFDLMKTSARSDLFRKKNYVRRLTDLSDAENPEYFMGR